MSINPPDFEDLIERANIDSISPFSKLSIEYSVLSKILRGSLDLEPDPVIRSEPDIDDDVAPELPTLEIASIPGTENKSDNSYTSLSEYLFFPSDPNTVDNSDLVLSTDLLNDAQSIKDLLQHRLNILTRNLFNSQFND